MPISNPPKLTHLTPLTLPITLPKVNWREYRDPQLSNLLKYIQFLLCLRGLIISPKKKKLAYYLCI